MLLILLLIGLLFLVIALWSWLAHRRAVLRVRDHFANRVPLDDAEFHERFYRGTDVPRDIPERVRRILAATGGRPVSHEVLYPDDRFGEIYAHWLEELDLADLFSELGDDLGVNIPDAMVVEEVTQAFTVAEVIRLCVRAVNEAERERSGLP